MRVCVCVLGAEGYTGGGRRKVGMLSCSIRLEEARAGFALATWETEASRRRLCASCMTGSDRAPNAWGEGSRQTTIAGGGKLAPAAALAAVLAAAVAAAHRVGLEAQVERVVDRDPRRRPGVDVRVVHGVPPGDLLALGELARAGEHPLPLGRWAFHRRRRQRPSSPIS